MPWILAESSVNMTWLLEICYNYLVLEEVRKDA